MNGEKPVLSVVTVSVHHALSRYMRERVSDAHMYGSICCSRQYQYQEAGTAHNSPLNRHFQSEETANESHQENQNQIDITLPWHLQVLSHVELSR